MKLKNLFFVNVLLVLLCFIGGKRALGQEVEILNEDFESYYGNATSSYLWTGSSEANCSAKIENLDWNNSGKSIFLRNVYDSDYFNKYAEWNTEEIDISTYENVSFSIDAAYVYGKSHDTNRNRVSDLGNEKIGHMIIEYQIAGGAWRTLIRIDNNKITNTYTIDDINSSSIKVRAKSKCIVPIFVHNKNKKTYYEVKYVIDNFILKGTKKASATAEKVLWLKADKGVSPSYNNISSWSDQSGNNNNASSYNGINEYNDKSLNYNPGVRFDESNTRFMTISDSPSLRLNEFSIFSVIKPINTGKFDAIVSKHSSSYDNGFGLQYFPNGSNLKLFLNANSYNSYDYTYPYNSATVAISNTAHIAGGIYDKTNIRVFTDKNDDIYSYNTDLLNNNSPLVIGADHTSISAVDVFNGDINEIMIYNYAVSEIEKNKIESYLAIKYGITLNHDYVSSTGETIYEMDDYIYDIAGLANDAGWGLNQKISSSSNKTSSDASNLVFSTRNSFNTTNKDNVTSLKVGESIIWGKNDGDLALVLEGSYKHVGERWKVNKNSDIYWTYLQLNLSAYPTPDSGSQYFLLIDDDETTANGITKEIQLTKNSDLYNASVNLPSGISYISVGYKNSVPMQISISGLTKTTSYGASDGQISFKVNGGNAPYSYFVVDRASNSNVVTGSCDEDVNIISSSMSGGDYRIAIRDNSGREISKKVFLYQPPEISSSDSGDVSECSSSSLSTNEISVTDPHDYCVDFSMTSNHLLLTNKSEINNSSSNPMRTIMF